MNVYKVHFLPNEPERPWAVVDCLGQVYQVKKVEIWGLPAQTIWEPTKKDHPRGWLEVQASELCVFHGTAGVSTAVLL